MGAQALDAPVRAALDACLEPGEQLRAWAWGPADLPPEPGAMLGQILVTLLGAFWRALISPLLRLRAVLGVPTWQQVLGRQCLMAVTDRRVLALPFAFQRRVTPAGVEGEVELVRTASLQAWSVDQAPPASVAAIRSTRLLSFPGHPGLVLGYAPDAGDERSKRAVALRRELLPGSEEVG